MTLLQLLAAASVPLLVAFVVACLRNPLRYALPPYAVLIPFSSLFSIAPGPFGSVSSLLGLLLGVALLAQLITTRRGSVRLQAVLPIWLTFLALCGLTLFWSIAPEGTVSGFAVLASQVLLFVALALTRFDRADLRRFETALVVGGVLSVAYGLIQLLFLGGLPAIGGGAGRFGDDLLGANNQAAALLLPIALVVSRTVHGPRVWRPVYAAVTLVLLLGVLMTGSRGGLLATVAVLVVGLALSGARRTTIIALGALGAALLAVVLLVNPAGIGERQVTRTDNSSGRSDIWAVGLHSCSLYCLTGAGWGAFPVVYQAELESVPDARVLREGTNYQPHNILLLAVIEAGVLGLGLVLLGLALTLRDSMSLPWDLRGPPVAAVIGTFVSSFFLSNLEFKFFWAVLAYVAVARSVAWAEQRSRAAASAPAAGERLLAAGKVER